MENEPIHKKRQRQRSLVLNLGKTKNFNSKSVLRQQTGQCIDVFFFYLFKEHITPIIPVTPNGQYSFDQTRRSFSASTKPVLKGRHVDSSSDEESEVEKITTSSELDDETSTSGGKDIDYAVLYDDTIEDFSYTSAREQARKRLLRDQQEMMLQQIKEQE
jgi:hypothetical protein